MGLITFVNSLFKKDYPKPSVTVDTILYSKDNEGRYKILLIKRKNNPYKDCWAFPGGFLDIETDRDLKSCGIRELEEETHIIIVDESKYEQFNTFGEMNRDPRGRIITTVYTSLVDVATIARPDDDAKEAEWFLLEELPNLAFDHKMILTLFCNKLYGLTNFNFIF